MKKLITLIAVCFNLQVTAQTYIDTTGGRYWEELFSNVTVISDINYGANTNVGGNTQILKMDIYEPTGDTVMMRPLIVMAHGGTFIYGTKTDQDVTALCTRFAKMGYVCASIEYRLGMGFPIDTIHAGNAVLRAVQDMKAAVRYFRMDASLNNTYHIHPDYIFAGGSSAGAFMALHLAYMDSVEVPSYINLNTLGGIEGASGNPGYASNVIGVINLCGALGDSTWIEPGDIPFVSMHGNSDQTVPYGSTIIYVLTIPLMEVDGSSSLKIRADNIGVNNPFHTWWGADHVPYAGTNSTEKAYMDSTVDFVKAFLRPFFGIPLNVSVSENNPEKYVNIYPNPATEQFVINVKKLKFREQTLEIRDLSGRLVRLIHDNTPVFTCNISGLAKGIYYLRVNVDNSYIIKKLVVE